ncbi:hypothetical protein IFM89_018805, partial [Coptis chinensis]
MGLEKKRKRMDDISEENLYTILSLTRDVIATYDESTDDDELTDDDDQFLLPLSNARRREVDRFDSDGGVDMISSLTDDISCQILSKLPPNYAVRSSTWSRRWRNLWTSNPVVNLDDEEITNYPNFVNQVLCFLDPSHGRKFLFRLTKDYEFIGAWLDAAIRCNATEIELQVETLKTFELPEHLYVHALATLKLNIPKSLKISVHVFLPTLKVLHLYKVGFADRESAENLFTNCPILEELILESCRWENLEFVIIFLPSVKRVVMYDPGPTE